MAFEIRMPQLGLTMKEGQIVRWLKKEGETVNQGEAIFSVENDKATVDVEAQASGMLAKILVHENETVPVGSIVGMLAAGGEKLADVKAEPRRASEPPVAIPSPAAAPVAVVAATVERPASRDGFVLASPLARKAAQDLDLRLGDMRGTGPEGAVLARDLPEYPLGQDVLPDWKAAPAASRSTGTGTRDANSAAAFGGGAADEPFRDMQLSRIREIAADRLYQSWTTIPQFTLYSEADASEILKIAARFKKEKRPVTLTAILTKLLSIAVSKHPMLNATWMGNGKIRIYKSVNVNVAMDSEDGLIVPVLKDCLSQGFIALGERLKDLSDRAKEKTLTGDDYEGGTITLSNLGMFGIKRFRAIINPPQAAILAVGAIGEKAVLDGVTPAMEKIIEFSITSDHRIVDGAYAARFMASLKELIENPLAALD